MKGNVPAPSWALADKAASSAPSVIDHCEPSTLPKNVAQNVVVSLVSRGR